jgi:hypothetical protein
MRNERRPIAGRGFRRFWPALLAAAALLAISPPSMSGNASAGTVAVICIQDDSNGNALIFNISTGAYTFSNCAGFTMSGTGKLKIDGTVYTLTDIRADRRLNCWVDLAQKRAKATYQRVTPNKIFTIVDRNTANDTCLCLDN